MYTKVVHYTSYCISKQIILHIMMYSSHALQRHINTGRAVPVDLDIFSPLRSRWPLHRMLLGHFSGAFSQIAVWLYRAKLR